MMVLTSEANCKNLLVESDSAVYLSHKEKIFACIKGAFFCLFLSLPSDINLILILIICTSLNKFTINLYKRWSGFTAEAVKPSVPSLNIIVGPKRPLKYRPNVWQPDLSIDPSFLNVFIEVKYAWRCSSELHLAHCLCDMFLRQER